MLSIYENSRLALIYKKKLEIIVLSCELFHRLFLEPCLLNIHQGDSKLSINK